MPTFHHANLGIPPELAAAEANFLIEILGYRQLEPPAIASDFGARWFEADDGTQVHLSLDPNHVPAAMAHTAIEIGSDTARIEMRLADAGIPFKATDFNGVHVTVCKDPAGNRWELRS